MARILLFPIQLVSTDELKQCKDADTLSFHCRLWATKYINAIQNGALQPTEDIMNIIYRFNKTLNILGSKELPIDFI